MADLRFGTFLAPNLMPFYEALAAVVGTRLGLTTELVVETDYRDCIEDVNDVCFVCSLAYITFERQGESPAEPVAAPVVAGARYGGRPIYFSDVIVRRDSPHQSLVDLRGSSWAYNEPLSQSGYGIARYHLLSIGETGGFFGEVIEAGYHETAMQMVIDGQVVASAIDSHCLAVELRENEGLRESVKVIDVLGPSPIQPVAVSRRLEAALSSAIVETLTALHADQDGRDCLELGMVDRIVAIGADHYDQTRRMLQACEDANFMTLQ